MFQYILACTFSPIILNYDVIIELFLCIVTNLGCLHLPIRHKPFISRFILISIQ